MSFLAPLFLAGALAAALPVLFHLIRRTTRERAVFSSLLFLKPTPPRLTRRSRIEHWLLLLLRCAVLCLLALGFARPFFKQLLSAEAPAAQGRRSLVLVDTSASMRRADLWRSACARVESVLRAGSAADQVALLTFDRELKPLVSFEEWNGTAPGDRVDLAMGKLRAVSPGWAATRLDQALITAAESLAGEGGQGTPRPAELVLVTDFQEGSRLEGLHGYEWPRDIALSVQAVKPGRAGNASLQAVVEAEGGGKPAEGVRVRVSNSPDSTREQFRVGWGRLDGPGFAGTPVPAYVPSGQSRIIVVPFAGGGLPSAAGPNGAIAGPTPTAAAAPSSVLLLEGDGEDFDNRLFVLPPEVARHRVLYFGADAEQDSKQPLYFLRRALQDRPRQVIEVLARAPAAPVSGAELASATFLVIADPVSEANIPPLRQALAGGQTALVVLKHGAGASSVAALLESGPLAVSEARPSQYAMLAEINFQHPLFAPFADPRFSDFTRIHFWQYRRLDMSVIPAARVLAKFDSGDPALVEAPVGKGRLLVLASGWHPEDSQLALSTKFVPLLYALLEDCSGAAPGGTGHKVGDIVPLPGLTSTDRSAATIQSPDGSRAALAAGATNFAGTAIPGIYTARVGATVRQFAVNLDPAESRTAPLPADESERLGLPMAKPAPEPSREAERRTLWQNAELENRQKLWRWCIVAALMLVLVETWLAGRILRRSLGQRATPAELS